MDDETVETLRAVRATLDSIQDVIEQGERQRRFPTELVPILTASGFVRGVVPIVDGGLGWSHLQTAMLMEEAGRCWGSLRSAMNILTLVAETITNAGTRAQKDEFLTPLLSGDRLGYFALTEALSGSDAGSIMTRAVQTDGGYLLSGRKVYITNASCADFGVVLATVEPQLGARGITAFLVDSASRGVSIVERAQLPVQAVSSCEITFEDVYVPREYLLGQRGRGLSLALRAVNSGRLNISAGCVGLAQAALDAAIGHATSRVQFGRRLAGFQLIQQLVADTAILTNAARQSYQYAARLMDAGRDARTECSMAKKFCSETANTAATNAVQVFGAAGLMEGSVTERLFRDAREATIPEGTTQIQILQIGQALLGESALR